MQAREGSFTALASENKFNLMNISSQPQTHKKHKNDSKVNI